MDAEASNPAPAINLQAMANQIEMLSQQLAAETARQTAAEAAVKPVAKTPKVATPDKFDGSRGAKAEAFASQVGLYIITNKAMFENDSAKVTFALSYLTGDAFKWAQPFLTRVLNPVPDAKPLTYDEFARSFEAVFFDSDRQKRAEAAIRVLKQTRSAAEYTVTFNQLAPTTKWEIPTLISHYRQGLKRDVRLAMIRESFTDLKSITALACAIDNDIRGEYGPPQPATSRPSDPDAMDISSTRFDITSSEYKRRGDERLCYQCGSSGHIAKWRRRREKGKGRSQGKVAELHAKIAALESRLGEGSRSEESKNGGAQE